MSKAKDLLNELLVNVFNYITNIENVALKQMGVKLSVNEVHILEAIVNTSYPSMSNVANKLLITPGTLTTATDKLVNKGYLRRYQEENDRRRVFLKLTDKGYEVIKIHNIFHDEMIEHIIQDMEIIDDGELLVMLDKLVKYFRDKYDKRLNDLRGTKEV